MQNIIILGRSKLLRELLSYISSPIWDQMPMIL